LVELLQMVVCTCGHARFYCWGSLVTGRTGIACCCDMVPCRPGQSRQST
jgi:hypothetical protein